MKNFSSRLRSIWLDFEPTRLEPRAKILVEKEHVLRFEKLFEIFFKFFIIKDINNQIRK